VSNSEQLLLDFQTHMQSNPLPTRRSLGVADKTIKGYVYDLSIFLRWWELVHTAKLDTGHLKNNPSLLNKKKLQDFLTWLETDRKYTASTILRHAASLRSFSDYLIALEIIQHDPTLGLRLPIKKQSDPKGLTDDQRAQFEFAFLSPWLDKVTKRKRTGETFAPKRQARDKAIAFLMLYAGPRVEETYALNLGDIEIYPRSGMIHIRKGKNAKERDVPLPKPARDALTEWLKIRSEYAIKHDALFVELRHSTFKRLSMRSIQMMVTEAGRRAGLDRLEPPVKITPHILRHTYLYMLRKAGVSAEVRAEMAGHSLETTMKYGSPKLEEKRRAADLLDDAVTI
jgi:site-specific recombinase XerD